jgi:hypothetical protein
MSPAQEKSGQTIEQAPETNLWIKKTLTFH